MCVNHVEKKDMVNMNVNGYGKEESVMRDALVLSKASKGKGSYGGQNDQPPSTKKSKAISMLIKQSSFNSTIVLCMILLFVF